MPLRRLKIPIGVILLEIADLSLEVLQETLILQSEERMRRPIGEILVEKGRIQRQDLEMALALQEGYPYLCVTECQIQPELLSLFSYECLQQFSFIPLERIDSILIVAMAAPFDALAIEEIKSKGYHPRIFLGSRQEIMEALSKNIGDGQR